MNYNELHARLEETLASIVREHSLAIEQLTERQVIKVFKELILSGDIQRYCCGEGQSIVYIPFNTMERLKSRIGYLEQVLKDHNIDFDDSLSTL